MNDQVSSGLGEYLAEQLDPHPDGSFVVDNDAKANWAMLKFAEAEAAMAEAVAEAHRWRTMIGQWLDAVTNPSAATMEYMEALLTGYLRRLRREFDGPEDKAPKSHKLPAGTIASSATQPGVDVVDKEKFVEWAVANNRLDLLNLSPSVGSIKHLLTIVDDKVLSDDEVVPGLVGTPAGRSFRVKPAVPPSLAPASVSHPLGSVELPTSQGDSDGAY